MGVDVRTIERTFEPPPMSRARPAPIIAPATASGASESRRYYLVDARGNGGAIAVNRLVAAGARRRRGLTAPLDVDGFHYEPARSSCRPSKTRGARR